MAPAFVASKLERQRTYLTSPLMLAVHAQMEIATFTGLRLVAHSVGLESLNAHFLPVVIHLEIRLSLVTHCVLHDLHGLSAHLGALFHNPGVRLRWFFAAT